MTNVFGQTQTKRYTRTADRPFFFFGVNDLTIPKQTLFSNSFFDDIELHCFFCHETRILNYALGKKKLLKFAKLLLRCILVVITNSDFMHLLSF